MRIHHFCLVLTVVALFATVGQAAVAASDISLMIAKFELAEGGYGYGGKAGVDLTLLQPDRAVHAVYLKTPGQNWEFDNQLQQDGTYFETETDDPTTLEELNVNGDFYFDVVSKDSSNNYYHSVYKITLSGINENSFPSIPTITSHENGDIIGSSATFTWTGFDPMAFNYIAMYGPEIDLFHPNYVGNSYTADGLVDGDYEFEVGNALPHPVDGYGFDLIESQALASMFGATAEDSVIWKQAQDSEPPYLVSMAVVEVSVPEPATLSCLALGALALLRRKNK